MMKAITLLHREIELVLTDVLRVFLTKMVRTNDEVLLDR